MILSADVYCQQSFDLYGVDKTAGDERFRLNSLEANTANFNTSRDWELSLVYGGILTGEAGFANDIFLLSMAKRVVQHYFYFRYTPGYKQEFVANSISTITSGEDSRTDILNTTISYQEKFGLGYSYDLTDNFTAGLTLRFYQQDFKQDNIEFVYGDSTTNTYTTNNQKNFWRGDIGFRYSPRGNLSLGLSTSNLVLLNENGGFDNNSGLELRTDKSVTASLYYQPVGMLNLALNYESTGSFGSGLFVARNIWGGKVTAGISVYHDKFQNPFINSLMPSIGFSSRLFNVSVLWLNYLSDRTKTKPITDLADNGIHNILNNQYSYDKILVNINFALSFTSEKLVKFIDLEIIKDIYPTLAEDYSNNPFAVASVLNISDETISVKPSSFIGELNTEIIYSPVVAIAAGDTADIRFYTIIDDRKNIETSRKIAQATFYLSTKSSEPDDEISKPVLINNNNSWDGNVSSLRYFMRRDYRYSIEYAKNVIGDYKSLLDTLDEHLQAFTKTRLLFNSFVQNIVYVSDPRSSVEYVQFPKETIERKGGDCDDLSVSFSALLESIGVQTAFIDYKEPDGISHVSLLVNTGISPGQASLITNNDKKYFIRTNSKKEDFIWIPIEVTSLTDFKTAWEIGSDKFYKEAVDRLGLAKGDVEIIDNY